ncbi:sugar ABC transporter ATP-binding protein [Rhodococcus qingshengii]|uniref:sugar ABC transporter ATP-binding protein n=1 Tax=Rhodococcus qingshengii TaxID=334542 RepID=UPI0036DBF4D8
MKSRRSGRAVQARAARGDIRITNVRRVFGSTVALEDVDLVIEPGTVHALVGENGAGKSTLMKILAGLDRADSGEIKFGSQTAIFRNVREAMRQGVFLVPQERAAIDGRSIADNILVAAESLGTRFRGKAERYAHCSELLSRAGLSTDPASMFDSATNLERAYIGILRACAADARVIILDEPTAYLSTHDASTYVQFVKSVRDQGITIVYVSHFLEEVLDIADSVSVLRDGRMIKTAPAERESPRSLIRSMVGGDIESIFPPQLPASSSAQTVLAVRMPGTSADAPTITVRAGEIVGIAGLMGSGRTEVALEILGATRSGANIELQGKTCTNRSPRQALHRGIAYLPEDRKKSGLLAHRSIRENVSVSMRGLENGARWFSVQRETLDVRTALAAVGAKFQHIDQGITQLSGGNQQKCLLARCLSVNPSLLIVDEPTRGVDVKSKQAIYQLLHDVASQGTAILMISSETEEIIGMTSRFYVMRTGHVVGEFLTEEANAEVVVAAAFGNQNGHGVKQ